MKSSTLLTIIFALAIAGFYGCSGDSPTSSKPAKPNITPPTAAEFKALNEAAIASRIQTAQFNAEDGITFTSKSGVVLTIPGGCLALNGNPASGTAKLEYMELFDRSDMLVTNKATMGVTPDGDKKILISGGAFRINVSQNGTPLDSPCHYNYHMKLKVPAGLTGGVDPSMVLWKGNVDTTGNLAWNKVDKDSLGVAGKVSGNNYYTTFEEFGYTNVDRFASDPRPKTTLQVRPPEGYNAENSSIYLSYDGETHALANLDRYDDTTGLFSEHYGMIPIGLKMHIIFVTEDNGQWRYAIQGVTVAQNDLYTFTLDETTTGNEQDIIDAVKALP